MLITYLVEWNCQTLCFFVLVENKRGYKTGKCSLFLSCFFFLIAVPPGIHWNAFHANKYQKQAGAHMVKNRRIAIWYSELKGSCQQLMMNSVISTVKTTKDDMASHITGHHMAITLRWGWVSVLPTSPPGQHVCSRSQLTMCCRDGGEGRAGGGWRRTTTWMLGPCRRRSISSPCVELTTDTPFTSTNLIAKHTHAKITC